MVDQRSRQSTFAPLLLVLGAAWGSSYLFIKVAVADLEPAPMMAARLLLAGVLLAGILVLRAGAGRLFTGLRSMGRVCLLLGAINLAVPTWLVAWGEKHIDSGTAAIAQATIPIFVLVLGVRFLPDEPVTPTRVVGIAAGLGGVALLVLGQPGARAAALVGVLAVVGSSLSYSVAGVYIRRSAADLDAPVLVVGELLAGGLMLLPFGLLQLPSEPASWPAIGSVAALTLIGTVLAQLILFSLLRVHGAGRVSLVTYLMPAFALVFGRVLLDEKVTAVSLAGLGLILSGVALAGWGSSRTTRLERA